MAKHYDHEAVPVPKDMKYEIKQPKKVKVNWVGDVGFVSIWTEDDAFIQVKIQRPPHAEAE